MLLNRIVNKSPGIYPLIVQRHLNTATYVQGQEPEPKIREYFYYIDHEGMVST